MRNRAIGLAVILVASAASAANHYWDAANTTNAAVDGGTGNWNLDPANKSWRNTSTNTNVAWTNAADRAIFGATAGTVTLAPGINAAGLQFDVVGYSLTGGSLQLTGSTLAVNADATIHSPITTTGNVSKTGVGELTLRNTLTLGGTLSIANSASGGGVILESGGAIAGTQTMRQSGSVATADRYTASLLNRGVHFGGGGTVAFSGAMQINDLNTDPVVGVRNATTLEFSGAWTGDGGNEESHLTVIGGGTIRFAANAALDFINDAYFTRQFWIYGDGTGTVEFAAGFVADKTNNGTMPNGIGSYRLGHVTLVTHSTPSLPVAIRPNSLGGNNLNGHLVWEAQDGGTWSVRTANQSYLGGLWVTASMTVETLADLDLVGVRTVWSDYTNYGGIHVTKHTNGDPTIVTKTGSGTLRLTGDQAYDVGSVLRVQQGTVEMLSNPMAAIGRNFTNGPNLAIEAQGGSVTRVAFVAGAETANLRSLALSDGAMVAVADGTEARLGGTLSSTAGTTLQFDLAGNPASGDFGRIIAGGAATLAGSIVPRLVGGFVPSIGDSFTVISAGVVFGGFTNANAWGLFDAVPSGAFVLQQSATTMVLTQFTRLGDVNLDGVTDNQDIASFVSLLTAGVASAAAGYAADVNADGVVNNQDIAPFVALLTGGRTLQEPGDDPDFASLLSLVPEPMALSLLLFGGGLLRRRDR
jgi:hypothetical protein